jgi:hypothetical protein
MVVFNCPNICTSFCLALVFLVVNLINLFSYETLYKYKYLLHAAHSPYKYIERETKLIDIKIDKIIIGVVDRHAAYY